MKKKLTITGVFNDEFTNYKDKDSSVTMIVDDVLDCTCGENRCLIHEMPPNYTLSDLAKELQSKQLIIGDVSHQRELLNFLAKEWNPNQCTMDSTIEDWYIEEIIEKFNCG